MRIRRRYAIVLAVVAAGAVIGSGFATAATTSHFTFKSIPKKVPKKKYKAGALKTDLVTDYDPSPSQANAVDRTRIYQDKNWKVNPKAAKKCDSSQFNGASTMAAAMQVCGKALVGKGTATAYVGQIVNGCVLLFNGKPKGKKPTLVVFTRTDLTGAVPDCSDPKHNNSGNATTILNGVYKKAHGKYGLVLDVNRITQATGGIPLVDYNTTIKHKNYASSRCKAKNRTWHMKVVWNYKDGRKWTDKQTQKCKVKHKKKRHHHRRHHHRHH
jgi:hypothetical protein